METGHVPWPLAEVGRVLCSLGFRDPEMLNKNARSGFNHLSSAKKKGSG